MVGVWSPHIIAELNRVLTLKWLDKNGDTAESRRKLSTSAKAMMDVLTKVFELVDTAPVDHEDAIEINDRDDRHLVRAARIAAARFVMSENTRDFPQSGADGRRLVEGIEFLTKADFFNRFAIN